MKSFVGSVALIRHPEHEEQQWLLKWSEPRQHYRMVTAERLEGESYRDCIDREIAWDLALQRNKDYLISSMSRLHIEEIMQVSGDCSETFFILEFFAADLYGKTSKSQIEADQTTRWISSREVLNGVTHTGERIDPYLVALLNKYELISPHA